MESRCQSCGMPFFEEGLYGTNADGTESSDYCKHCFTNGNFGNPDETMEEMIETCIPFEVKSDENPEGYPDADTARKVMLQYFPSLKRWKIS